MKLSAFAFKEKVRTFKPSFTSQLPLLMNLYPVYSKLCQKGPKKAKFDGFNFPRILCVTFGFEENLLIEVCCQKMSAFTTHDMMTCFDKLGWGGGGDT